MNAFDPIAFAHKLEQTGFKRPQAEVLASELRTAIYDLVTKEQLQAALDRQTIRLGGMMALIAGVLFAALKLS